ncbi:DUF1707 domain-containing protein [Amycolatopsis ultiminotia]|uniref:DUF1707 domain-containing protein n=1 Tax=Amycolatopsis ultiminotia TaxID=543629 RepID=A0ABP6VQK6_9PSEU
MTEVPSPQLRISDQERESALKALGEHMSAGRIDIDEYGERSARITAAKTRGELAEMFADLPAPHPAYGGAPAAAAPPAPAAAPVALQPAGAVAAPQQNWSGGQRFVAAFLPLIWVAAIALIATGTTTAWVILVPIALSGVGRALWGKHFDHSDHHDRRREHRLEHHQRHREMRDEYRRRRRLDP